MELSTKNEDLIARPGRASSTDGVCRTKEAFLFQNLFYQNTIF
jgi:hypothetical protein